MAIRISRLNCVIFVILPLLLASSCTVKDADRVGSRDGGQGVTKQRSSADQIMPRPDLSPEDVVRIQVEALRSNDSTDAGIAIVYKFNTPSNRKSTGPIERFARMIKGPEYASMLQYTEVEYLPVSLFGDVAQQLVVIEVDHHEPESFLFILSKQKDNPNRGCWMTEAVIRGRLEEPDQPRQMRPIRLSE